MQKDLSEKLCFHTGKVNDDNLSGILHPVLGLLVYHRHEVRIFFFLVNYTFKAQSLILYLRHSLLRSVKTGCLMF